MEAVQDLLRQQSGVIGRSQCFQLGMTASAIENRLRAGEWRRVAQRTYADPDRWGSFGALCWMGVLWAGGEALLCGAAAASWWGMDVAEPATIRLAVPVARRTSPPSGVSLLRRPIDRRDRSTRRGLRLTGRPLTTLMTAVELGDDGPRFLDRALQSFVTLPQLQAAQERNTGRHGAKKAGRLLGAAADGTASEAERRFLRLLRSRGITGWEVNVPLEIGGRRYVPDVLFRAARVIVEIDGWAFHSSAQDFQRDRARQNALALAGWTVLRFTWQDLTQRPHEVLTQLQSAGCGA